MGEAAACHGYAGASVERVIALAGASRSTFYEHFRNREECFLAAFERAGTLLLGRLDAAAGESEEQARAVLAALIAHAISDPVDARLLYRESLSVGPHSLRMRAALQARVRARLLQGLDVRDPAPPATDVASFVTGGIFRLLGIRLSDPDPHIDGGFGEELGRWALPYLRGPAVEPPTSSAPSISIGTMPLRPDTVPADVAAYGRGDPLAGVDRRRERACRALARCAYSHGYAQVSVSTIVEEAQMSRRGFYALFEGKEHVALEANRRVFQVALGAAGGAFFGPGEWAERIWAACRELLDFLARHPTDAYLAFVEPHAIGPPAVAATYDRLEAFAMFLEGGYLQESAKCLPRLVSEALTASVFEFASAELILRREEGVVQALPAVQSGLVRHVLAPYLGSFEADRFVRGRGSAG